MIDAQPGTHRELSLAEVATILGVSRTRAREYARDGVLAYRSVTGRYRDDERRVALEQVQALAAARDADRDRYLTLRAQGWLTVAEIVAHLGVAPSTITRAIGRRRLAAEQFLHETGRRTLHSAIGARSGQGQPHRVGDGDHDRQPPVGDLAVPPRRGPGRLGVDTGVRHFAGLAMLLVPDPATSAQAAEANGDLCPATVGPTAAAAICRRGRSAGAVHLPGGPAAVPRCADWEAPALVRQLRPDAGHLGRRCTHKGEQSMGLPDSACQHQRAFAVRDSRRGSLLMIRAHL